ncbi:DUF759 family protein, partial [Borreliella afzelii]
QFSLIKGTLTSMKQLTDQRLILTGETMANLVSSGQASMQEAAAAIDEYIRGYGDLYKIMSGTRKGEKYTVQAKENYEENVRGTDFNFRFKKLEEIKNDYASYGLTKFSDEKEKIDSNLTKLEQSLMDVTAAGMQPVLEGASEIIEWVRSIMKTYKEGGMGGIVKRIIDSFLNPIFESITGLLQKVMDVTGLTWLINWIRRK